LDEYETRISDGEDALSELTSWYQDSNGYPEAVETLADFIKTSLLPTIKFESVKSSTCVTAQVYKKTWSQFEMGTRDFLMLDPGHVESIY
jgi:hypothetical protein